jgi:hypothetical protein
LTTAGDRTGGGRLGVIVHPLDDHHARRPVIGERGDECLRKVDLLFAIRSTVKRLSIIAIKRKNRDAQSTIVRLRAGRFGPRIDRNYIGSPCH